MKQIDRTTNERSRKNRTNKHSMQSIEWKWSNFSSSAISITYNVRLLFHTKCFQCCFLFRSWKRMTFIHCAWERKVKSLKMHSFFFCYLSLTLSLSSQKQIVWSIGNGFIYQEFICTLVCVCESACIWVEIEPHLLSKSTNKRKLIMRKENKTECTGTTIVPFNNWKGILIPFANVDWYHFTIVYAINDDWASF